jgi:hypothetical protein
VHEFKFMLSYRLFELGALVIELSTGNLLQVELLFQEDYLILERVR